MACIACTKSRLVERQSADVDCNACSSSVLQLHQVLHSSAVSLTSSNIHSLMHLHSNTSCLLNRTLGSGDPTLITCNWLGSCRFQKGHLHTLHLQCASLLM